MQADVLLERNLSHLLDGIDRAVRVLTAGASTATLFDRPYLSSPNLRNPCKHDKKHLPNHPKTEENLPVRRPGLRTDDRHRVSVDEL